MLAWACPQVKLACSSAPTGNTSNVVTNTGGSATLPSAYGLQGIAILNNTNGSNFAVSAFLRYSCALALTAPMMIVQLDASDGSSRCCQRFGPARLPLQTQQSLAQAPGFNAVPGQVFDNDTQDYRAVSFET